jgi:putative FmdB family regulatory protein
MPLYEYECEKCGHRFEVIQKFSDAPIETCPKCGSKVHKMMSSPAIQFKGSGWYITDYARKESTAAGKTGGGSSDAAKPAESTKSGDSTTGTSSSSDSTPAAPATK